jgi:hypothetical protein
MGGLVNIGGPKAWLKNFKVQRNAPDFSGFLEISVDV